MASTSTCDPFRVCFRHADCWDADIPDGETSASWVLFVTLLTIGICMIALAEVGFRYERCFRPFLSLQSSLRKLEQHNKKSSMLASQQEESELSRAFVTTKRTEDNFIRNNADPDLVLPAPYNPEYEPEFQIGFLLPVTGFLAIGAGQVFSSAVCSILLGSCG